MRRLRTWWHLLSSRLREMVDKATSAEKAQWFWHIMPPRHLLGPKVYFWQKYPYARIGGVPSVSALFKYIWALRMSMWTIWVWLDRFFWSQTKTNSPERRYEGFGLNFLVAEEEHSLSCRNTQYWGRLRKPKLSRNGFRMDAMRHSDWENDRAGPTDLFRLFQIPKNL